jgi:hypothetical protein
VKSSHTSTCSDIIGEHDNKLVFECQSNSLKSERYFKHFIWLCFFINSKCAVTYRRNMGNAAEKKQGFSICCLWISFNLYIIVSIIYIMLPIYSCNNLLWFIFSMLCGRWLSVMACTQFWWPATVWRNAQSKVTVMRTASANIWRLMVNIQH